MVQHSVGGDQCFSCFNFIQNLNTTAQCWVHNSADGGGGNQCFWLFLLHSLNYFAVFILVQLQNVNTEQYWLHNSADGGNLLHLCNQ